MGESISANRPTAPGKALRRWARSWLASPTRCVMRSLRARQGAAQGHRLGAVRGERAQPGAVGAQRVGEHERVEPVVLVAGRAVASAQVLDLVRADHHHRHVRREQGVDDRPVRALDRDLASTRVGEHRDQLAQAGGAVLHGVPDDLASASVDHRHRVIVAGPVQAAGHVVGWLFGQGVRCGGRLHVSLLAASPSGEAPSCGAGTWLPVRSLIGARWRSALSTVRTSRVTTRPRRSHAGHRPRQASRAMTWRHLGRISNPSKITDTRMVHQ
jgi:hypothetical protein